MTPNLNNDVQSHHTKPRQHRFLRAVGRVLCVLALTTLGLGAGLWIGSPASADTLPLEVDMLDGAGFSTSTPKPLLTVSGLAPGGTISGEMKVRDRSGKLAGSGESDALSLRMINVVTADGGPAGGAAVNGSGAALRSALRFTIEVFSEPSGTLITTSTEDVASLSRIVGVPLANGLVNDQVVRVRVSASLPDRSPELDDRLQYGSFAFDLELTLSSEATPSDESPTDGTGNGDDGNGADAGAIESGLNSPDDGDGPASIDVLGAAEESPDDDEVAQPHGDDTAIVVLGESAGSLSNTGVPVVTLLAIGGTALLAGACVLYFTRRHTA